MGGRPLRFLDCRPPESEDVARKILERDMYKIDGAEVYVGVDSCLLVLPQEWCDFLHDETLPVPEPEPEIFEVNPTDLNLLFEF